MRTNGKATGPLLVLTNETGATIKVPLDDCCKGPGLGVVNISVVDGMGNTIVPDHRYHFDVRTPESLNLNNYVEEPGELPNLPAFLQVEPYQQPGNNLIAASRRLADDLPRVCPRCGGPLHLRLIEARDIFYPVLPDGGVADAFDPSLTWRDDVDGEIALVCLEDDCGWESGFVVYVGEEVPLVLKGGAANGEEA